MRNGRPQSQGMMAEGTRARDSLPARRPGKEPATAHYRRRRITFGLAIVLLCFTLVGALIALSIGRTSGQQVASARPIGPVEASGEAHPAFATFGQQELRLPVAAQVATIIGYEPTSDSQAVSLTPLGTQAGTGVLSRILGHLFSSPASIRYYMLDSPGTNTTGSVDVGAPAGATVTSPVTGMVAWVESYELLGKYDDVEIDITPQETSGLTVSLMFIADPLVTIGEVITAGQTALGQVRACPPELKDELAVYTHDPGAHVHLEVTQAPVQPAG